MTTAAETALDIFAPNQPDEPAIGCRDQRRLVMLPIHVLEQFDRAHIGPKCARSGAHHVADAPFRIAVELGLEHPAEHDALFVHDDARAPVPRRLAGDAHRVVDAAGGNISPRDVLEADGARGRALEGQPIRAPISLPGRVFVDLAESESVEPPRGPWAQVSLEIVAVDDHRTILGKERRALGVELLQRDVDGPGDVLLFVLLTREDLDDLRAFPREALQFFAADDLVHQRSPFVATATCFRQRTRSAGQPSASSSRQMNSSQLRQ